MYVRAGRPVFAWPCVGVLKSTSLMSSSLLLQQCPACLPCFYYFLWKIIQSKGILWDIPGYQTLKHWNSIIKYQWFIISFFKNVIKKKPESLYFLNAIFALYLSNLFIHKSHFTFQISSLFYESIARKTFRRFCKINPDLIWFLNNFISKNTHWKLNVTVNCLTRFWGFIF